MINKIIKTEPSINITDDIMNENFFIFSKN